MVFCYNIVRNWGGFWYEIAVILPRYSYNILGKLMDFGLKLVNFGCLAARFFCAAHENFTGSTKFYYNI